MFDTRSRWGRRGPRAILVAAAALLGLAGTGAGAADMSARLAQNLSPISGVTIVAKEKGFFEEHGLDIAVSNFTSGKQCLNTVLGGGAEIATTAEAPTTAAAMSNQPIAFLARMEYSDLKTLTRADAGIAEWADLKGKKLAFTAGTGSEVYTMSLLDKAGLTADDVSLTNLRPQDMLPALLAGDIDAFNIWEPHVSNAKKVLGDQVSELDTQGVYSETFNIVVMKDYLEENPELIRAFLAAMIDAEAWMKANREDAITLVADAAGMERADLAPIWDDYVFHVTLDQKQMDVLQAHAQWRLDSGNHPPDATMPDFSTVVVPGPLRDVAPDRVQLPSS
ncbi:ABC transporter substrate-binding protein [Lutibaculum baratangense]|uniref:ABC transporter substrate-binding protein n=1 Tax=Lutibaculum baratangense AMV1 TaxID=631454 RepID=V4RFH0_9HYPH|nr:NrtA/SsuA/CpmA family ABC transporter substrate-binding protein [Lutibaculum baratangense]ESR24876.1 ABC transporter substrate-binding protein [Lutibaculum baratangense AMV1]